MKSLSAKYIALISVTFFIVWGFFFSCFLPGIADNDISDVFKMILGVDFYSDWFRYTQLNDHNPLVYVFFNWSTFSLAKLFCSDNLIAISFVCFIQMCIIIASIVYSINKLYGFWRNKIFLIISILFFLLNPLIIQYSMTHWKDMIFASLILMLCTNLLYMIKLPKEFSENKFNLVFTIFLILICAFWRKNGIFISLILLVILIIKFKDQRKIWICTITSLIVLFVGLNILKPIAQIQNAHFSESVSIPLQQIAYTATQNENLESNQEFFENILPVDEMRRLYDSITPDTIKFSPNFNDEFLDSHKMEFLVNWIQLGCRHIPEYIIGWAKQSCAFWYPFGVTWYTVGIGVNLGDGNLEKNLFDNFIDSSNLKSVLDIPLNKWNPLYNPPFLVYVLLICCIICLAKKQSKYIIALCPLLLLWISLLLSAPACDFRYVYPLHLFIPWFIYMYYMLLSKKPNKIPQK